MIPVVHQDIWLPEVVRRNSNILDIVIFRDVPSHICICPFLEGENFLIYSNDVE